MAKEERATQHAHPCYFEVHINNESDFLKKHRQKAKVASVWGVVAPLCPPKWFRNGLDVPFNNFRSHICDMKATGSVELSGNRAELTLAETASSPLRRKGKLLVVSKQGVEVDAVNVIKATRADRFRRPTPDKGPRPAKNGGVK